MKSAEEFIADINAQEGANENPCNIKPHELRHVIAEVLREAARIKNGIECSCARSLREKITAKADEVEKGEA